jgi:hypothetical protein
MESSFIFLMDAAPFEDEKPIFGRWRAVLNPIFATLKVLHLKAF